MFFRNHRKCLFPRVQKVCDAPGWIGAGHTGRGDRRHVFLFWSEFLLAGKPEAIENLSQGQIHV
jgi:hypothetical protein